MNLYDVLGIDADAQDAMIRDAWKRAIKRAHPDVPGGSRKAYDRVQTALAVLSDPKRRQRYDSTGEFDDAPPEPDNKDADFLDTMTKILDAIVTHDQNTVDMLVTKDVGAIILREVIPTVRRDSIAELARLAGEYTKWKAVAGRFVPRRTIAEVPNYFEAIIKRRLAYIDVQVDKAKAMMAQMDRLEEMLTKHFKYRADQPRTRGFWPPAPPHHYPSGLEDVLNRGI